MKAHRSSISSSWGISGSGSVTEGCRKALRSIGSITCLCVAPIICADMQTGITAPSVPRDAVTRAADQLRKDFPTATMNIDPRTGRITDLLKIETSKTLPNQSPDSIVRDFLARYEHALGPASSDLRITTTDVRPLGTIVRVQQYSNNVPVEGAQATFITTGSDVIAVQAAPLEPRIVTPKQVRLTWQEGVERARSIYKETLPQLDAAKRDLILAFDGSTPSQGLVQLLVFNPQLYGVDKPYKLAWKVQLGTLTIYIDAVSGEKVHVVTNVQNVAPKRKTFDCKGQPVPGELVLGEGVAAGVIPGPEAIAAHQLAADVADYFATVHHEKPPLTPSTDTTVSEVRFRSDQNAFWHPTRLEVLYGPGWATAYDIAGHELTHALIQSRVHLPWSGPGNIVNEFLADLFGSDFKATRGKDNWTIGESVPMYAPPNAPLRDLANPHNNGFDPTSPPSQTNNGMPASMDEFVKPKDPICGNDDDACSHLNSGIPSHACYLASVGGPGIVGIGRARVARIMYEAMLLMTPQTHLDTLVNYVRVACATMTSRGDATTNECTQLIKAYATVGLQ